MRHTSSGNRFAHEVHTGYRHAPRVSGPLNRDGPSPVILWLFASVAGVMAGIPLGWIAFWIGGKF